MYKEFTKDEFITAFPELAVKKLLKSAIFELKKIPEFKNYNVSKIKTIMGFDFSDNGYKNIFLELTTVNQYDYFSNGILIRGVEKDLDIGISKFAVSDVDMPDEILDRLNELKKELKDTKFTASMKVGNEEYKKFEI